MTWKASSLKESLKLLRLPIYGSGLVIGAVATFILLTGGWAELHKKWTLLLFSFSLLFLTLFILVVIDRRMSKESDTATDDSENS